MSVGVVESERRARPVWFAVPRVGRQALLAEVAIVVALLLIALVLRVQGIAEVPRYTDEVNETMTAIDIARGRILPLVSPTRHIGAFFNYLVAGVILVTGKSPDLPRYVALFFGVMTVILAYAYG